MDEAETSATEALLGASNLSPKLTLAIFFQPARPLFLGEKTSTLRILLQVQNLRSESCLSFDKTTLGIFIIYAV